MIVFYSNIIIPVRSDIVKAKKRRDGRPDIFCNAIDIEKDIC